ncbi:MAG: sulfotransferase family 2 domain-containing protein, partial [Pseudomonadota bacterium]
MPIFQHNGKLHAFVHVPKCGGTTIETALEERFGRLGFLDMSYYRRTEPYRWSKTSPQHITWDDLTKLVPEALIDRVFAMVRCPFRRFASAYNHGARSGHVPPGMTPEEWFDKSAGASELLPYRSDNHLRQAAAMVPDRATVFRLEDGVDAVLGWIDTTFGTASATPPRDGNVSPLPDPDRYEMRPLSDGLRTRLAAFYAEDFERFGYDPTASDSVTCHVPLPRRDSLVGRLRP